MLKNILKNITWTANIGTKKYGSGVVLRGDGTQDNKAIKETVDVIAQQMTETLQTIINGKSDRDIELDKKLAMYKELGNAK